MTIGGGTTLTHLMELFDKIGAENPDYWYTPILAEHIGKIGSTPVRNVSNQYLIILNFEFKYIILLHFFRQLGSIAGNLMLKHAHIEFPSDVFICFETVGAKVNLSKYLDFNYNNHL